MLMKGEAMQFGITIPLSKHLKMSNLTYGEPEDLFYCWELHNIRFHGKHSLIIVNANNRFTILLWGMKAKEWKDLSGVARKGIEEGFYAEGFSKMAIRNYFDKAGEVVLTKTHGRRPVAFMNKAVEYLEYYPIQMDKKNLYQNQACNIINRDLCHAAGFKDYGYAVEFLKDDMKRMPTSYSSGINESCANVEIQGGLQMSDLFD